MNQNCTMAAFVIVQAELFDVYLSKSRGVTRTPGTPLFVRAVIETGLKSAWVELAEQNPCTTAPATIAQQLNRLSEPVAPNTLVLGLGGNEELLALLGPGWTVAEEDGSGFGTTVAFTLLLGFMVEFFSRELTPSADGVSVQRWNHVLARHALSVFQLHTTGRTQRTKLDETIKLFENALAAPDATTTKQDDYFGKNAPYIR
ncbi:hypothetical protein CR51_36030 [Caballeronia megalochromosomata]|nr:hypothetical protein CR51_36030 [Caballeronia megalochromosomata]